MKPDPRAALVAVTLGGLVLTVSLLLALRVPLEGFLTLLFASSLLWFFLPFLLLYLWRRLRGSK